MYPCIESILVKDGQIPLLEYHVRRYNFTQSSLYGCVPTASLEKYIQQIDLPQKGIFKLRIVYDQNGLRHTCEPYQIKGHQKVLLIENNSIDYTLKFENRTELDELLQDKTCDDFIVIKNGFFTDAWYSNVAFEAKGQWFTPESFLLRGVKRQFLLETHQLTETKITLEDLNKYSKIAFINAMRDFEKVYTFERKGTILHLSPTE